MYRRIVDRGLIEPVGTVPAAIHDLGILLGDVVLPDVWFDTLDLAGLVDNLHILLGIQRSHVVGVDILPTQIAVERHIDVAGASLSFLGGDEDDTVRGTGTVDGAGGCILQNVDALDVVWRKVVDIGTRHTIDHIKRGVGTSGTHTTDGDLVALTRLSGVHDDVHT